MNAVSPLIRLQELALEKEQCVPLELDVLQLLLRKLE